MGRRVKRLGRAAKPVERGSCEVAVEVVTHIAYSVPLIRKRLFGHDAMSADGEVAWLNQAVLDGAHASGAAGARRLPEAGRGRGAASPACAHRDRRTDRSRDAGFADRSHRGEGRGQPRFPHCRAAAGHRICGRATGFRPDRSSRASNRKTRKTPSGGAGRLRRGAGGAHTGAEPFRPAGYAASAGLDDARQPRSGDEGAENRAGAGQLAQAQLKAAHDLVSFTELAADAPGVVTAVGPRAGIGRPGRPDDRDAGAQGRPRRRLRRLGSTPALRAADGEVTVRLTERSERQAHGRVREVAPQADPVTRTFEVRVGLTDPPSAMLLGATVTGQIEMRAAPVVDIPASALTRINQQPAVWIVDPANMTVQPAQRRGAALRSGHGRGRKRARHRRDRRDRRRTGAPSRPESPAARGPTTWAASTSRHGRCEHRSVVDLPHDPCGRRGDVRLSQARPQRGPGVRHQDDGRAGRLARRHDRRNAEAGDRAARAQAPGNAATSITSAALRAPA